MKPLSYAALHPFRVGDAVVTVREDEILVGKESIGLAPLERRLLTYLLPYQGFVRTKRMIMHALYPSETEKTPHWKIIDVLVCKISRKLEEKHPHAASFIKTRWGRGAGILLHRSSTYAVWKPHRVEVTRRYDARAVSVYDLPDPLGHWTIDRKAAVVQLVKNGTLSLEVMHEYYPDLAEDEFLEWQSQLRRGVRALRATSLEYYAR